MGRQGLRSLGLQTMARQAKSEVEECIFKLQTENKGVQIIIIVNNDGVPIRWLPANLEPGLVVQHASLISELALRAEKAIQDLDPMNGWSFLRVRSHKHEIMVCPEKEFMMIVVQDPNIKEHSKVDDASAAK